MLPTEDPFCGRLCLEARLIEWWNSRRLRAGTRARHRRSVQRVGCRAGQRRANFRLYTGQVQGDDGQGLFRPR